MSLRLRAAAYSPNGARLGVLPTPLGIQGSMVLGDVGAFSISYPSTAPKAPFLSGACEVALEVSYDDGQTWTEPNDARYLRLRRKGDQVDAPDMVSYEGPSYLWLLDKSPVLPEGALNSEGKRAFLTATVGTIMRTLIQEAQARGELPGLDASTFSAATDSNGAAWGTVVTLYYDPGMSYLTILRNLSDQGLCDFTMAGRSLRIYKPETVMAGASGATLLKGRDLTEAPYTATLEGLASYAFLMGDGGKTFERANPAAPTPWGRWTTFISQGGVSDTGTMTALSDAALDLASEEREENTYGLDFSRAKALPFRDYKLGQTVAVSSAGAVPEPLRLRQITVTRDEKGTVQGNVVLNDRFLENEVRQTRRVQGITGGSSMDGGSGGRPDNGVDRSTPKAPTALTTGSVAYLDDAGKAFATVTLDWADVTQNTDNTAVTDLAGYDAFWRLTGDATWTPMGTVDVSQISRGGFRPNTSYDFAVQAFDTAKPPHRSALSAIVTDVTEGDTVAPGKPSTPTVEPYLGQLLLGWDGLLFTGGTPPTDFARAEFQLATVADFSTYTVVDTATARGPASTVATGLDYGATYYVRLRLYDNSGNASVVSNTATGVPVRAAGADLSTGSVTFDALAFKQPGNYVEDGTLEDATYRAKLATTMYPAWSFDANPANAWAGSYSLRGDATNAPLTYRLALLATTNGIPIPGFPTFGGLPVTAFRVQPGERWLMRAATKRDAGFNGTLNLQLRVHDKDGNYISAPGASHTPGTSYATASAALTIPAGGAYAFPAVQINNNASAGTAWVDDIEVRPIIGTLLVDDAAITNVKIASMVADKITAGAITAAITVSGRIATALTGARVEVNSAGIKQYNASGVLTVDIPVTGTAVFSGTLKSAQTGPRVEIGDSLTLGGTVPSGVVFLYSGVTSETSPGQIYTTVVGSGSTADAKLVIASPRKNSLAASTITMFSRDADTGADIQFDVANGSYYYNSDAGFGTHYFRSGATSWGILYQNGSGLILTSSTATPYLALGATDANLAGNTVKIIGYLDHSGGDLKMTDGTGARRLAGGVVSGLEYVQSDLIWARTGTASGTVNVNSAGTLYRVSSSERYKVAVDRDWANVAPLETILALTPATYYDRGDAELMADLLHRQVKGRTDDEDYERLEQHVQMPTRSLGLIAEDVDALGLTDLVLYGPDGKPEGVHYDRLAVALLPVVQDMARRLAHLESVG